MLVTRKNSGKPFPPSWAWIGLVTLLPGVQRHKTYWTFSSRRSTTSVSQLAILRLLLSSHHPLLCLKGLSCTAQRRLESKSSQPNPSLVHSIRSRPRSLKNFWRNCSHSSQRYATVRCSRDGCQSRKDMPL